MQNPTNSPVNTLDLKATDALHREKFRADLIASIQEELAAAHRPPRLATFWNDLDNASSALKPQLSLDHSNLTLVRKVKKVASDAKRLQNAISILLQEHPANAAVLEDCMHHASSLVQTMSDTERISQHADQMGDRLKATQNRDAWTISCALTGQAVLHALVRARVRIRTRNDYNSRPTDKEDPSSRKKQRSFAYLPPIDRQSSLAMKCAMLVLFDAGHQRLDWSLARRLILDGTKFRIAGARMRRHIADTRDELLNAVHALSQL
jgi:hypothetical protein